MNLNSNAQSADHAQRHTSWLQTFYEFENYTKTQIASDWCEVKIIIMCVRPTMSTPMKFWCCKSQINAQRIIHFSNIIYLLFSLLVSLSYHCYWLSSSWSSPFRRSRRQPDIDSSNRRCSIANWMLTIRDGYNIQNAFGKQCCFAAATAADNNNTNTNSTVNNSFSTRWETNSSSIINTLVQIHICRVLSLAVPCASAWKWLAVQVITLHELIFSSLFSILHTVWWTRTSELVGGVGRPVSRRRTFFLYFVCWIG